MDPEVNGPSIVYLFTHFLQNILFYVQQKKETQTPLEQLVCE